VRRDRACGLSLGTDFQLVEKQGSFSRRPISLAEGGDTDNPIGCNVRLLTHKVIHTIREYLLSVFKKNDLGRFAAICLESLEHYNSRND
jgi:hypothetical protein